MRTASNYPSGSWLLTQPTRFSRSACINVSHIPVVQTLSVIRLRMLSAVLQRVRVLLPDGCILLQLAYLNDIGDTERPCSLRSHQKASGLSKQTPGDFSGHLSRPCTTPYWQSHHLERPELIVHSAKDRLRRRVRRAEEKEQMQRDQA